MRATPRRLLSVHRQFPNLTMIAAHMGGEDNYDETQAHLLGTGIYFDTAFVLRLMPKSTLERFFSRHPVERFLFGTDSSFTDQATEVNYLLSLPFLTQAAKSSLCPPSKTLFTGAWHDGRSQSAVETSQGTCRGDKAGIDPQ